MTSRRQKNMPNPLCTNTSCANDGSKDTLDCSKCNRSVHYLCTKLPAYMIAAFNDGRRINCIYVCPNCVTVSDELLALDPLLSSQPSFRTTAELCRLKEVIKENEKIIKNYRTNEHHLLKIVETQKEELTDLKKKMSNDPAFHTLEYVEKKLEKKLENMRDSILSTIKDEYTKSAETYAAAVTSNLPALHHNLREPSEGRNHKDDDLTNVIASIRKAELAEERARSARASNIIVHGLHENNDSKKDDDFAANLVKDLHTKVIIKSTSRIGTPSDEKKRPIKITLQSENEKFRLMGNLSALKGVEKYKGISITEDLCQADRKVFKDLSDKAKEINQSNPEDTHILRVRGNSKNGFHLKKVPKNTQITQ